MKPKLNGAFLFLAIVFAVVPASSQQSPDWLILSEVFNIDTDLFTADQLGNIYYTTRLGLVKYYKGTQTRKQYSNPRFGHITQIDATDPFNIMVFHGGFRHIVWLDRNMAIKEGPGLPQTFIREFPALVGHSALGGFWAYFTQQNRLQRFNQNFQQQAETLPFSEILIGFNNPVFMAEANSRIYISDPNAGIAVFDAFGNFLFLIEKKGIVRFQVLGNMLIYFSDKELIAFDFLHQQETLFLLPVKNVKSGLVSGRQVFLHTENEIRLYHSAIGLY